MDTSPNKERYRVLPQHEAALEGLLFFTLKNSKNTWVIPTTKNFIGEYQIKKIKCDDGATCSVFPLESTSMLRNIFLRYGESCSFSLIELQSVGGNILGLGVAEKLKRNIFPIHIGTDIYPFVRIARNLANELQEAAMTTLAQPISASTVRNLEPISAACALTFFLCTEDVSFLLHPDNADLRGRIAVNASLLAPYGRAIKRRTSALLGSDFLGVVGGGGISFDRAKFYFNPQIHRLELCTWPMMSDITLSIKDKRYLMTGSVDFQIMDSIEPNDIIGVVTNEEEPNPYDIPNVEV